MDVADSAVHQTCVPHRIPLRMNEEALLKGDDAAHSEEAHVFGPCQAHEDYIHGHQVLHGQEAQEVAGEHHASGSSGAKKEAASTGNLKVIL